MSKLHSDDVLRSRVENAGIGPARDVQVRLWFVPATGSTLPQSIAALASDPFKSVNISARQYEIRTPALAACYDGWFARKPAGPLPPRIEWLGNNGVIVLYTMDYVDAFGAHMHDPNEPAFGHLPPELIPDG